MNVYQIHGLLIVTVNIVKNLDLITKCKFHVYRSCNATEK